MGTNKHIHRRTDKLTYIREITTKYKYAKDITAVKNNALQGHLDAMTFFSSINWRNDFKIQLACSLQTTYFLSVCNGPHLYFAICFLIVFTIDMFSYQKINY